MKIATITTEFNDIPNKISMSVFTSGCYRNCKGCHNPELQDFNTGDDYTIDDLLKIYNKRDLCNSICFTGGDPIYQYSELIEFCKILKENNIYVGLYTGESFENINKDLLNYIDYLVTDPYEDEFGGITEDTTNQRVWDIVDGNPKQTTYIELKLNRGE